MSIPGETGAGVIRATFQGDRVTINLTEPKEFQHNQKIAVKDGTELAGEITAHGTGCFDRPEDADSGSDGKHSHSE